MSLARIVSLTLAVSLTTPMLAIAQVSSPPLRELKVEQHGVTVRVPDDWRLVERERNERAFMFSLPRIGKQHPGYVVCELSLAPESLAEYQKRHEAADLRERESERPRRELIYNEVEDLKQASSGGEEAKDKSDDESRRLVSVWKYNQPDSRAYLELRNRVIRGGTLYTFVLVADEGEFENYRVEFEAMLAAADLSEPDSGLEPLPDGRWLQTDYHFAMRLPESWKPAFGQRDEVLFFATGETHEVFTDNLLVLARRRRPLDLEAIKKRLVADIQRVDPQAEVTRSEIVAQGIGTALETVIRTERGPFRITVLERRFQGQWRNYEVKFTCQSDEFDRLEPELLKALDSFREVSKDAPDNVL